MSHRQHPSTLGSNQAAIAIVGSMAVMRCVAIDMGFGAVVTDPGAMGFGVVVKDAGVEKVADTIKTAELEPAGDEIALMRPRAGRLCLIAD